MRLRTFHDLAYFRGYVDKHVHDEATKLMFLLLGRMIEDLARAIEDVGNTADHAHTMMRRGGIR